MNATTFQTSSQKQNDYKEMKNAHKLLKRRENRYKEKQNNTQSIR